ncbi:MAG: phosphoribosylformylglycinamidine synthase I [Chthoniobacterales bacterium]|nr:phosphoribosylformylglycinamidine synthase I [Chthoniobacterales bacterium]
MERGKFVRPSAVVLGAPGTNRHEDAVFALNTAGADASYVNLLDLPERSGALEAAALIVVAGGFSYADALGSGRVFAMEIDHRLGDLLRRKVTEGTPVIGICNGFQMLVRSGLLPGGAPAALQHNDCGHFECRWVTLAPSSRHCIWTRGLDAPLRCPVAHGEGKFSCPPETLAVLRANDRIAFRYAREDGSAADGKYPENPNGSVDDIAGICDDSGLVLGMMPHPENHVTARQGRSFTGAAAPGLALPLFRNGVEFARKN